MIVYLVEALRGGLREQGHYIVGAFSQYEDAVSAKQEHEYKCGGKYICDVIALETDRICAEEKKAKVEAGPELDLQEQVEALQAYVDVMQNYVLVLKDAMMIILDMPDIRKAIGEKATRGLSARLSTGRRSTWDDEMRKHIKERR